MSKELIIVIVVIVILLIVVIEIRNAFVEKMKKIERNKSLVDVYLKKRYDLIPNLVEVCKGYSKFEKETLESVIKLRSVYNNNPSSDNEHELSNEYKKLLLLVENYPELKASDAYLKLQKEMANVENEIQASRRIYINSITSYNNLVMKFPSSLIAKIFGFKEYALPTFNYEEIKIKF